MNFTQSNTEWHKNPTATHHPGPSPSHTKATVLSNKTSQLDIVALTSLCWPVGLGLVLGLELGLGLGLALPLGSWRWGWGYG